MARYTYIARWKIADEDFCEMSDVTDAMCDGHKSVVGKVRAQIMDRYPELRNRDASAIDVVLDIIPMAKGRDHPIH